MKQQDRDRAHAYRVLREFSEKRYNFEQTPHNKKPSNQFSYTNQGLVTTNSGYLVICEPYCLVSYKRLHERFYTGYDLWTPPKMLQGVDFVSFGNLWGDGMFAVLSSGEEIFVETKLPTEISGALIRSIEQAEIEEKHGSKKYRLEGLVGVGGGIMTVTDPKTNRIDFSSHREEGFEIATIIATKPGNYSVKFVKGNKKLQIKRSS